MKKEHKINWSMNYEFFKGQLPNWQTISIWKIIDSVLAQGICMREEKAAKALAYTEKNQGEQPAIV